MVLRHFQLNFRRKRGFSLIELMVALALGLVIVAGVLQIFVGSRQTFLANEGLARVQENLRFSNEFLKTAIRGGRHFGFCGMRPEPTNHLELPANSWQNVLFNQSNGILGWEAQDTGLGNSIVIDPDYPRPGSATRWSASPTQTDGSTPNLGLPDILLGQVVEGTDVIIVRELLPIPGVTSPTVVNPTTAGIGLDGDSGLESGDLVLVTDCNDADLFRNRGDGTNLSRAAGGACDGCPGNLTAATQDWSTISPEVLQVYRVRISAFYIGYNEERQEPGLYRMDLSGCPCGQTEELATGVESLQALYGYSMPADEGGDGKSVDAGRWLTAAQLNDWWPVIGVRLGLLHRSPDRSGEDSQRAFNLAGTQVIGVDEGNMRHDGTVTLALRNRVMFDD